MFCQIISYLPGTIYFGWSLYYLAVGVVDLEGHPLPVQLDLLGVDQLGTVLILTDEPSIWKCRSWIYVNVDKTEM